MRYEFEEKLKNIICSCCDLISIEQIDDDIDLVRDYGFNSINIIQLLVKVESEFDIEVDDEDLTVDKLASYVALVEIVRKCITSR